MGWTRTRRMTASTALAGLVAVVPAALPTADAAPGTFREVAALARLLSRRDDANAVARLNARVAQLYQLSAEEFEHVLTTFPLVPKQARDEALKLFVQDQQ